LRESVPIEMREDVVSWFQFVGGDIASNDENGWT
jgi:hypothetical protein